MLENTAGLPKLENAVFKYLANLDNRAKSLNDARDTSAGMGFSRITVPKFALEKNPITNMYYLFEERLDMDANWYFQHDLYAYLYEKAKTDNNLKTALTKALEELTTFVCQSSFNDVKFDNNPISKYGTIALIDPERAGPGNGPAILLEETKEFYTPGDYKNTIKAVITTFQGGGVGQCKSAAYNLPTEADLNKAKTKADAHQTMMEKVAQCRIKKGVIDFDEPIDKSNLVTDFPNLATRAIAEEIIDKINQLSAAKTSKYEKRSIKLGNYANWMSAADKATHKPVFFELIDKGYLCDFANGNWGKATSAGPANQFDESHIGDIYF